MEQRSLVSSLREQTALLFGNLRIVLKTYDREAPICGTPSWRYVYHTLHSCDKWYVNPSRFTEPPIHTSLLDKVDLPTDTVLSDAALEGYLGEVEARTYAYLDALTDADLYQKPEDCPYTRLELALGQFRHFMCHIGILNGITIANTGKYPYVMGLDYSRKDGGIDRLYDE